jgi:hypothetical protein
LRLLRIDADEKPFTASLNLRTFGTSVLAPLSTMAIWSAFSSHCMATAHDIGPARYPAAVVEHLA